MWLDGNYLSDNIALDVSGGIRKAAVVIVLLTNRYLSRCDDRDRNIHKEFILAISLGLKWILPLVMEPDLLSIKNWKNGVVKFHLSDSTCIRYSNPKEKKQNLNDIILRLRQLSIEKFGQKSINRILKHFLRKSFLAADVSIDDQGKHILKRSLKQHCPVTDVHVTAYIKKKKHVYFLNDSKTKIYQNEDISVRLQQLVNIIKSKGSRRNGRKYLNVSACLREMNIGNLVLKQIIERGVKEKRILESKLHESNLSITLRTKMSKSFF